MNKVIIGVHGLANKPPEDDLESWWRASILDGLQNIGASPSDFEFDLCYWAGLLYKNPLHTDEHYNFDSLFNDEPYTDPHELKDYEEGWLDHARAHVQSLGGAILDAATSSLGENPVQRYMLGKLLKDLSFYYDPNRKLCTRDRELKPARLALDEIIIERVRRHAGKKILLVSHSMGSIISYNALRDLGQQRNPVSVHGFVTIGSPLGLPFVRGKILEERQYDPITRTPTVVEGTWINFADKDDPVALDERLRDDYKENASGVRVRDDLVFNDYRTPRGDRNPHKSYGYLRTPELSRHLAEFLTT